MKLKGDYNIKESGKYIIIFEDEAGEEWEVEFDLWIDKEYIHEETGKCLIDVNVQAKCLSPVFSIEEEVLMEIELEEYITDYFNL